MAGSGRRPYDGVISADVSLETTGDEKTITRVSPKDAATVILLRPCRDAGVQDIEVLLALRNQRSSFVPGYHVFPGGGIDPQDYEPGIERFIRNIDRQQAAEVLADMSDPQKALGAWVAAIRETFEEVGLLIARRKDGTSVTMLSGEEGRRFNLYRTALIAGEIKFAQMLEAENLLLPLDCISYFSHWITPEPFSLRYDVRFFVTEAPAGQDVVHDGIEIIDHIWIRPSVALMDYENGKLGMVLPQIMTLVELSRFQKVADVISSAAKRSISALLTRIEKVDGKAIEVMPDGAVFKTRPPVYR